MFTVVLTRMILAIRGFAANTNLHWQNRRITLRRATDITARRSTWSRARSVVSRMRTWPLAAAAGVREGG
jgi:hypothetical protein